MGSFEDLVKWKHEASVIGTLQARRKGTSKSPKIIHMRAQAHPSEGEAVHCVVKPLRRILVETVAQNSDTWDRFLDSSRPAIITLQRGDPVNHVI